MKRRGCAFVILLVLLLLASLLLVRGGPDIEDGSTLVVELGGEYVESADPPLLARLIGEASPPFARLLAELHKAQRDDRIDAVLLRIRDLEIGWAKIQELRQAVLDLARAGKRTAALLELESFGANLEYYLASAANSVHVAPGTTAPVVGLAAEYLFLGGLWEKLGVEFEVERVGRYKTAADTLAGREMSEAHREMADALLDSIDAQFVAGISEVRGLTRAQVRKAIDAAPVRAEEMMALGMIDGVSQFDQVVEALGGDPVVEAAVYAAVTPEEVGIDPVSRFALIYGTGAVVVGHDASSPVGAPLLASDVVGQALRDAAEDDSIDAVILRIDSPGGSALASDQVWRATQRLKESGKPLVVSMSDLAASGGYYVACGADVIFADPATLTGSIGVFVLRPVLRDLYAKLDVGVEGMTRGQHADLLLASRPLSPESRQRLRREVQSIYDLFVERVAEGREMSPEQVDDLGRGRVWTGAQARERGLVDELGGLRDAVARTKAELDLDPEADVLLVPFPQPQSLAEQLGDLLGQVALRAAPRHPLLQLTRRLEPWWSAPQAAPVLLPPFTMEIR
jgi:protease-4